VTFQHSGIYSFPQVVSTVEVSGEVDSMLLAGGFLFVGFHKAAEGIIKVWNMSTGTDHILTGHKVTHY
jgi:hypothetical protein